MLSGDLCAPLSETYALLPKPFLKWAGGKRRLLEQLSSHFPAQFRRYFEPFVGGGAVFFHLSGLNLIQTSNRRSYPAVLADLNEELINCYRVVKEQPEELIEHLRRHKTTEAYYYKLRELRPSKLSPLESASRFIYLNKTCFNGLYRVNSAGQFNVPYGRYKNPVICDETSLRLASAALQKAKLSVGGFEHSLKTAKRGDFIYLDPPYVPVSATANFTSYTSSGFTEKDQERLAEEVHRLDRAGCLILLSNSDTDTVRQLYRGFHTVVVRCNRAINSQPTGRGAVNELLVRNYN